MTNNEALQMTHFLNQLKPEQGSLNFVYSVSRNLRLIAPVIEAWQAKLKPIQDNTDYANYELALKEEKADVEALKVTYAAAIAGHEADTKAAEDWANEEAGVEWFTIPLAYWPEDIERGLFLALYPLVAE